MSNLKKIISVKNILELILMIFLYAILDNVGGIKKYIVVLVFCMVFFWNGRKNKWSPEALLYIGLPVIAYVLLGGMSAFISVNTQTTAVKVMIYWIVPLVFTFALYTSYGAEMSHIVDVQFFGSILAYKIFDAPVVFSLTTWESVYAFGFGVFAIYYAYKKRWKMFALAMIFVYFAEKRIAILAVLIALFLLGILWLFSYSKKLVLAFWGLIVAAIYAYIYFIYSGVMEAFCWGANINTNGRVEIYSRMAHEFEFSLGYFGEGLGIVEQLLEYWKVTMYGNLHNDLLKFYIELGFGGLLLFLLSYGVMFYFVEKRFGKSKMCYFFAISAYTMMLFATDNTSIYMIYLIPMYVTMFAVLASERQAKIEKGSSKDDEKDN